MASRFKSESNVYIPLCSNVACEERLLKIAQIVTKCTTKHEIYGSYAKWFKQHFDDCHFTIIHYCSTLWQKVHSFKQDLHKFDNKLILLKFSDIQEQASIPSNSDLPNLETFFNEFGSVYPVSSNEELHEFAELVINCVRNHLGEEEYFETASQEDEGYPRSEKGTIYRSDIEDPSNEYNYIDSADTVESENYNERKNDSQVFKKYPDIFGETDHQHVFVNNCHICDSIQNIQIYKSERSTAVGQNIRSLNNGQNSNAIMANNKFILLKELPKMYSKKDMPALASVCACNYPIVQKRALILLEFSVWEGINDEPNVEQKYLINAEIQLDNVLKDLKRDYQSCHDVLRLALFERASNVYFMILSAIIMSSRINKEASNKCNSFLDTIRSRISEGPLNVKDKVSECLKKINEFVEASSKFIRVRDKVVSVLKKVTEQPKEISKCAKDLLNQPLITQVVVTFEVLRKVFEQESECNSLTFLREYLAVPKKGILKLKKLEPEAVCIVMVFRALTLYLKYYILHLAHKDVQDLCKNIIEVLQEASHRDLPAEVVRSLHSLLFHPNSLIRNGISGILDVRKKYSSTQIQYMQYEITGILDPIFKVQEKSKMNVILFRANNWKTLPCKFGSLNAILCVYSMGPKDKWQEMKVSLENHEDINYNEMFHLVKLQHKNIIQLFAYQRFQVPLFYVLEDCSQNLQAVMKNYRNSGKYFTHRELCQFLLDAITALQYCHDNNRIHRNLTAQCLTFMPNKSVKLSSFGLCMELGQSQMVIDLGNQNNIPFRWSAPESMFKSEYTKMSDIWMVGILIYEVRTHGILPFSSCKLSDVQLGEKIKDKSIRLNSERCIDDGMSQLIAECTNYEPEARPYIENVKTRVLEVIQQCTDNPRTTEQYPYPKLDRDDRQPSEVFNRGLPNSLRTSTAEKDISNMSRASCEVYTISDILTRLKPKKLDACCFREKVPNRMPPAMLSLLTSEDLKMVFTQTIKIFQSRESTQYFLTAISPFSESLQSLLLVGHFVSLQSVLESIFQVAVKLSKIASMDLVLGDFYPSAVYLEKQNFKQVYIISLAFMKRPCEDEYHLYNQDQPEIPQFMIPRAAPEVIQERIFSKESDVYCFGNFMWESLKAFELSKNSVYVNSTPGPFNNLPVNEVRNAVLKNEWEVNNKCPVGCPDKIYQLIKSCVSSPKTERPTMRHVVIKLKEYCKELFDVTLGEYTLENSPRSSGVDSENSGSSLSLSVCNPSTITSRSNGAASISESDWGSMFSDVAESSLEEINPSEYSDMTTTEADDTYGFSSKYVSVDYHTTYLPSITNAPKPLEAPPLPERIVAPLAMQEINLQVSYADEGEDIYETCESPEVDEEIYNDVVDIDDNAQTERKLPEVPLSVCPSKPEVPAKPSHLKKPLPPLPNKPKPKKK